MKKLVVLTGAGISAESGLGTFRDQGGLWDKYPVEQVATPEGWRANPALVTEFYNTRRTELLKSKPNQAHLLLAALEKEYEVTIITQNVDDLHERAGSSTVIHLHGELMKVCSSKQPDNPHFIHTLSADQAVIKPGTKSEDGSLLRPYIVWFGEAVPLIEKAAEIVSEADIFVVIGTSLNVYPAAGLLNYAPQATPIYIIDPKEVNSHLPRQIHTIQAKATSGVAQLFDMLIKK